MTPERIAELRAWALALITGPCTCHLAQRDCPWPEATPEIRADLLSLLDECEKTMAGATVTGGADPNMSAAGSSPVPGPSPELKQVVDHIVSEADERALETIGRFINDDELKYKAREAHLYLRSRLAKPAPPKATVTREQLKSAIDAYQITGPHNAFIQVDDIQRFLCRLGVVVTEGK